jgi:hypothetical protein
MTRPAPKEDRMTNEERIAEWLFLEDWDKEKGWAYTNELSGDWKEVSPEGRPHYLRIARSLLTFLDSLGFVQKDVQTKPRPHLAASTDYEQGFVDAREIMLESGFVRVKSILAQEGK